MRFRGGLVGITVTLVFGLAMVAPVAAIGDEWVSVASRNPPLAVNYCSYGKFFVGWNVLKLQNDGSTAFDWFMVAVQFNSVPGILACGAGYYHSKQWERGYISAYDSGTYITEYGPTTTSGTQSISFSLGLTISASPGGSFSVSFGYAAPDVRVLDRSSLSDRTVTWYHDMVPTSVGYPPISSNSYMSQPAYVIRAGETDCFYINMAHAMAVGHWHDHGWGFWEWHEYYTYTYYDSVYVC